MQYFVYAGSKHRRLVFRQEPMYGSEDFSVALSYAKNRYAADETYVHRLIFNIRKAAGPDDVDLAIKRSGRSYESEGWLSQGDSIRDAAVRRILESWGFDGAVNIWDFGFDGPEEIQVLVVFDASRQVEVPDKEPFYVSRR
jgi:hypothetical protein